MDENKGPHLRKLYAEVCHFTKKMWSEVYSRLYNCLHFWQLAELWPDGWMDNLGIKLAVHRAQERKKRLNKASNVGFDLVIVVMRFCFRFYFSLIWYLQRSLGSNLCI